MAGPEVVATRVRRAGVEHNVESPIHRAVQVDVNRANVEIERAVICRLQPQFTGPLLEARVGNIVRGTMIEGTQLWILEIPLGVREEARLRIEVYGGYRTIVIFRGRKVITVPRCERRERELSPNVELHVQLDQVGPRAVGG